MINKKEKHIYLVVFFCLRRHRVQIGLFLKSWIKKKNDFIPQENYLVASVSFLEDTSEIIS